MKRGIAVAVLLAGLAAFAQYAPQSAGSEPLAPELENRVQRLGKQLRCAVCQGLSITDSPSSMARAQLDVVRTLVQEGKSDDEIKQYFVERYGEWALLEPKKAGANWLVWGGPVVLLVGGLAFIFWYALRQKENLAKPQVKSEEPAKTAPPSDDSSEDPYLRAVRAELEK